MNFIFLFTIKQPYLGYFFLNSIFIAKILALNLKLQQQKTQYYLIFKVGKR
jgi:hypothetical protein